MEFLEKTIEIPCDQCNGIGKEEVFGNCRDQSNECCGGCTKIIECELCDERGEIDMTIREAIDFEGLDISDLYEAVYNLKKEIKQTSLKDLSDDIISAIVKDFTARLKKIEL